jgi:DUF971 family protein
MVNPPTNIRALQERLSFEFQWDDGSSFAVPFKFVRGECPCASCIEEWTGRRLLDLNSISDDVKPTQLSFTGNYALKIGWSDGHATGLYTWDHLADICRRHAEPQ